MPFVPCRLRLCPAPLIPFERGEGGQRGPRGQARSSLVLRGSGAAGPERAQWSRTQAEATRSERHRKSDERQQRRGSKEKDGETGDDKHRQHDCAEEREGGQQQRKYHRGNPVAPFCILPLSKVPSTGTSCASPHVQAVVMHRPPTFDLLSYHINVAINITAARLAPVIGDPPMYSPKVINYTRILPIYQSTLPTQFRAYDMPAASPSASIRVWHRTQQHVCVVRC
jgi:hypothetical protein